MPSPNCGPLFALYGGTALSCQRLREVTLESREREQKAQHRHESLNESLRRVRVEFERHSSEAEGRVAQLKVIVGRRVHVTSSICRTCLRVCPYNDLGYISRGSSAFPFYRQVK